MSLLGGLMKTSTQVFFVFICNDIIGAQMDYCCLFLECWKQFAFLARVSELRLNKFFHIVTFRCRSINYRPKWNSWVKNPRKLEQLFGDKSSTWTLATTVDVSVWQQREYFFFLPAELVVKLINFRANFFGCCVIFVVRRNIFYVKQERFARSHKMWKYSWNNFYFCASAGAFYHIQFAGILQPSFYVSAGEM